MIPIAIEEYARRCELNRAAMLTTDNIPDFKMYVVEGVAYIQPINARARDFICGFDNNYIPWKPLRLSATDLDILTASVKDAKIKITMEMIEI